MLLPEPDDPKAGLAVWCAATAYALQEPEDARAFMDALYSVLPNGQQDWPKADFSVMDVLKDIEASERRLQDSLQQILGHKHRNGAGP
jgi:hypothetical protein